MRREEGQSRLVMMREQQRLPQMRELRIVRPPEQMRTRRGGVRLGILRRREQLNNIREQLHILRRNPQRSLHLHLQSP